MKDSLLNGFLIFGIAESILFASLFFTKKNIKLPDKFMGVVLFISAIQIAFILLNLNFKTPVYLRNTPILLTLFFGPLIFLYVKNLNEYNARLLFKELLHFLPFFLMFAANLIFLNYYNFIVKLLSGVSIISGTIYCILTYNKLLNHKSQIMNEFSFKEKVNLVWISNLIISFLIIWSGVVIIKALNRFYELGLSLDYLLTIIPVFVFYIGFYGFKQNAVFQTETNTSNPGILNTVKKSKHKSELSNEQMKSIFDLLLSKMKAEKLYLNQNLCINDLSKRLQIPKYHITQTLNEYGKQNFFDFVNTFRTEKVRERIRKGDADQYSLSGIAFDCGFKSTSSFMRIFKKFTGMSPSEYEKRINDEILIL